MHQTRLDSWTGGQEKLEAVTPLQIDIRQEFSLQSAHFIRIVSNSIYYNQPPYKAKITY